jgi:maltodextrin utilization protein YvdJ
MRSYWKRAGLCLFLIALAVVPISLHFSWEFSRIYERIAEEAEEERFRQQFREYLDEQQRLVDLEAERFEEEQRRLDELMKLRKDH